MRLILRTQTLQSKLEGRDTALWQDRTDDYAVVADGPMIGRIYRQVGSSNSAAQWRWCLQVTPTADGYAATLEEAKAEIAKAYVAAQ